MIVINDSVIVVTAANSKYFAMLRGLVTSLQKHTHVKIGVIDCGLLDVEKTWLGNRSCAITQIERPSLEYKEGYVPGKNMYGYTERHNITNLFPGHDIYMWMDSDTWMQTPDGIDPYIMFARMGRFAVVPEVGRQLAFNDHHRLITKGWSQGNYEKFYSKDVADAYSQLPMFNSGVFAARVDNPVWDLWPSAIQFALDNNGGMPDFGLDQISLNFVLYSSPEVKVYPLPLEYNWMLTHAMPYRCNKTNELVGPLWPYPVIGVVHMLDNTKWNRHGINRIDRKTNIVRGGDSVYFDYFSITGEPEE